MWILIPGLFPIKKTIRVDFHPTNQVSINVILSRVLWLIVGAKCMTHLNVWLMAFSESRRVVEDYMAEACALERVSMRNDLSHQFGSGQDFVATNWPTTIDLKKMGSKAFRKISKMKFLKSYRL